MTYAVENCIKCGGTHFGSYDCPFTDEQAAEYRAARLRAELAACEPAPSKAAPFQLSGREAEQEIERLKAEIAKRR